MKEISGYNDVERTIKNPTPANIGWVALNFVPIGKVAKVGKIAYKGAKAIKAAKKAEKAAVKIGKAAARKFHTYFVNDLGIQVHNEVNA